MPVAAERRMMAYPRPQVRRLGPDQSGRTWFRAPLFCTVQSFETSIKFGDRILYTIQLPKRIDNLVQLKKVTNE